MLEEEASDHSTVVPEGALLPEIVRFLRRFPCFLDIVVHCARKTEVAKWSFLFSVVGTPTALYEVSLLINALSIPIRISHTAMRSKSKILHRRLVFGSAAGAGVAYSEPR